MLHIISKSPFFDPSLKTCLRMATADAVILLIEDGVYAVTKDSVLTTLMNEALLKHPIYALIPDIEARGLQTKLIADIKLIDYDGFVDLVVAHQNVQSWL